MKKLLVVIALVGVAFFTHAQPTTDDHSYGNKNNPQYPKDNSNYNWSWDKGAPDIVFTPPPLPIPVDGGASILLLVGGALGYRQFRRNQKK